MTPKEKIHLILGDITESDCQAIVNAANTELWLGSGVAGAIRERGGPSIQEECQDLGPVDLGEAAVTGAGNLKAQYIIHAASMDFDTPTTEESLYDAVKNSFLRAEELELSSIAFPAIGTGVADFDVQRCAEILFDEIQIRCKLNPKLERIEVVLFDQETFDVFKSEYDKIET